jgi:hypothetical protein
MVLQEQGKLQQAKAYCHQALELNPQYVTAVPA